MARRRVTVAVVLLASAVAIPAAARYAIHVVESPARFQNRPLRAWIAELKSPDRDTRLRAIFAAGAVGPHGADAVPALAEILTTAEDADSRYRAALALAKIGPASRGALPGLTRALDDPEPLVRLNAANALLRLGEEAAPAVPALIRALQDEANATSCDQTVVTIQEIAAMALVRATRGRADAVPALLGAMGDASPEELRVTAARALGEVGPAARPAAPALRRMLREEDDYARETAREALEKIEQGPVATDAPEKALALPAAERAYLWEIEHAGNLLGKHGFAPLARAVRDGDRAALTRLLADGFAGGDLREPRRTRAATDYAEVERLQDAGRPPRPLSRGEFADRLLGYRKVFAAGAPQVKFALMTLSPTKRRVLDGPWLCDALLRLHGEHAKGAPAEVTVRLRLGLPRPTEEALAKGGWLRSATVLQEQKATAPRYLFAEVARSRGLDPAPLHDNWQSDLKHGVTGGVYVCDFDRDGILDVLVVDVNVTLLYKGNLDGTFTELTRRLGLPREPANLRVAAWADLDGDGWEDLILGDRVFRNDRGERFTEVTARCALRVPPDATSIAVADYDRDGKLDLYVTRGTRLRGRSWLDGKSGDGRGNVLYRNKGDWRFENVTKAAGAGTAYLSAFTAAWLDVNNDGWPDLHVVNEFGDGVLLVNKGDGTFTERRLAARPADFGSMGLAVGDIDNDGHVDLFCANMYSKAGKRIIGNLAPDAYPADVMEKLRRFVDGSQLHLNRGGLKFEQAGQAMQVDSVGWSYGACLADLDNDGFLDLYATAGFISCSRDEPDG